MKAALLHAPQELEIVEQSQPEIGPRDVLLRVRAAGICGSDVHAFRGSSAFQVYPGIPGHEIVAEIVATGEAVDDLEAGDHVILDPMLRCGKCYPCRTGRYNCCTTLQVMGVHTNGGFAEFVAVSRAQVNPISKEVPFTIAAMTEPLCISSQAVTRGRVSAGDTVVVIGAGTIGLGALLMAKSTGARVASVDPINAKLDIASRAGAELTVNPIEENVSEAINRWTSGEGANVVIEAVGRPDTIRAALDYVSSAGRVVLVGITPQDVPFPIPLIIRKELDIIASRNSRDQFPHVISLIESGAIDPQILISHVLPFEQISEAFRLIQERPEEVRKVVLQFP